MFLDAAFPLVRVGCQGVCRLSRDVSEGGGEDEYVLRCCLLFLSAFRCQGRGGGERGSEKVADTTRCEVSVLGVVNRRL